MKKIEFALLWHQHQPFYKDTLNNIYRMPWVLMHSMKDYVDMLHLVTETGMKATFNLVPVLLYQIEDYLQDPGQDELFAVISKKSSLLSEDEVEKLTTYAFDSMDHKKIHRSTRYHSLLTRYKEGAELSPAELHDLQVHLLLAWLGHLSFLKAKLPVDLLKKDRNYTDNDKNEIIEFSLNLVNEVIPAHREAFLENKIEVTTTPFFHPILPLLHRFQSAKVASPDVSLPPRPSGMAEDVSGQLQSGREYTEKLMQKEIKGFWPSEGSVSPETMKSFAENNITWVATDGGILANSFHREKRHFSKNDLYRPYSYSTDSGEVYMFFRDTELSDLIGFTYSQWNPEDAVEDFIKRLAEIRDSSSEETPLVSVILDGENAWEAYKNNGYDFLHTLYTRLVETEWITPVTFSEALEKRDYRTDRINDLHSGSWIYSNLLTWIGHREKNKAWELLSELREVYGKKIGTLNSVHRKKAEFELFAAEGSDWFWWYGDDFYSHFSDDFDALFRLHVANVYRYLNEPVPDVLYQSIRGRHKGGLKDHPQARIYVQTDGEKQGYFDWLGAGEFDLTFDASTMHRQSRRLSKLFYGPAAGEKTGIYMAIEGDFKDPLKEILEVEILDGKEIKIEWDLEKKKLIRAEGIDSKKMQIAQSSIIEFFIPHEKPMHEVQVQFTITAGGKTVEKAPLYSRAKLPLDVDRYGDWVV